MSSGKSRGGQVSDDAKGASAVSGAEAGTRGGSEGAWQPEGWRTGPAWRELNGRSARRRRVGAFVGIPVAVALALIALCPEWALSHLPGGLGDRFGESSEPSETQAAPAVLPAESVAPTAAPSAEAPDTPTLQEPFLGSPALRYAEAAEGIVLPEAEAVGAFSESQVAEVLETAKKFLVASNPAPATLRGERPEGAIALVDPLQPDMRSEIETALRAPDEDHDPTWFFSRFDPDEVRVVGDVVKTRGRMTFAEGEEPGTVDVHADYTFVYPLVKAESGATEIARTIVRRSLVIRAYDPAQYQATPGKLSLIEYSADRGNDDCRVSDGFLHLSFDSDLLTAPPATGPAVDPYDRSRPLDAPDEDETTCGTVTRT